MTVRLLVPYGKYPKNTNLTTGAETEAMLLRTGQADTNTAAGATYVDPVPTERSGPTTVESTGGVDSLRADGRELLNLSAAQALVSGAGTPDLVVYGANPGGLFAAIAAARQGARVTVLQPDSWIGGMLTGGLSATDISLSGYSGLVVGMANEFYAAVAAEVGQRQEVFLRNGYAAPPRVFERVLRRWMAAAGVRVITDAQLLSVSKSGTRITRISTTQGTFTARTFVDGTYEGDLLAMAGCSFVVGREPNTEFTEFVNGNRLTSASPQLDAGVSPYVIAGNPASGLLPGLSLGTAGVAGAASTDIMAVTFRMTLCQVGDAAGTYTKLPMPEPDAYDPMQYEALGRHIAIKAAAAPSEWLTIRGAERSADRALVVSLVNSTKVDWNSGTWAIGTNYVSPLCAEYPTASYARRAEIRALVKRWVLGWFKFLRTDSRVPAAMRADAAAWGIPSDEDNFIQLYVRAGRRMRGDFVLTEAHCRNAQTFTDGVGVIYYELDSHVCRRFVEGGVIYNEGSLAQACYGNGNPLPFRAMLPKASECTNLLVTFAVSATYAAFCSIRMEPKSMAFGEAAGIAAWLAAQRGIDVANVVVSEVQSIQDRFRFSVPGGAILAQDGAAPFNQGTVSKAGTWNVGTAVIVGHPAHAVSNGTSVIGSTSGSSTTLTIASTAAGGAAVAVGQYVVAPGVPEGVTIASIGTYNAGSGTVILSTAVTLAGGTSILLANGYEDWFPNIPATGAYDLLAEYVVKSDTLRSNAAPVLISNASGSASITLQQNSANASSTPASAVGEGGNWVNLGRGTWRAGSPSVDRVRTYGSPGGSVFTAFKWVLAR